MASVDAREVSSKRVVAVIGATGGIGTGIAERVALDSIVALGYFQNASGVTELQERITVAGGIATTSQVDIRDGDSVQAFLDGVMKEHGQLDSLVLSTGYSIPILPMDKVDDRTFGEIVEVELIGSFNVIKRGIHLLRQQHGSNRSICCVLTAAFARTLEFDGMSAILLFEPW
ncbi:hypothetical protein RQP46_011235 [Phenoliferia psychrophenolica]